jgi:DNA modification methylase
MSLKNKINSLFKNCPGKEISVHELYSQFSDQKKTTVRGRLYELLGKTVKRVDKGLYVSATSIVQYGNAVTIIDKLVESGKKFDYIFLDIPYLASGQRSWSANADSGNRNLSTFSTISPRQFNTLLQQCERLLSNEHSFISFMFTSGKSSAKEFTRYENCFRNTELKQCAEGSYTKLWSNGNRMNMGKHLMPPEYILVYNKSGVFNKNVSLDFSLVPPMNYPTAKPFRLVKQLVQTLTNKFDWVLDPFGGSGATLKACNKLNRHCFTIDNSPVSIFTHLLPVLCSK